MTVNFQASADDQ